MLTRREMENIIHSGGSVLLHDFNGGIPITTIAGLPTEAQLAKDSSQVQAARDSLALRRKQLEAEEAQLQQAEEDARKAQEAHQKASDAAKANEAQALANAAPVQPQSVTQPANVPTATAKK